MIPVQTTYLRPRSGIVHLALIPVLIFVVIANTTSADAMLKLMSAIMLLVPIGMYVFITNSYVELNNESITAKNPFKTRTIEWKDVARSYFKVIHTGKSSKRMWYFENFEKSIRFATNLYSRRSLQTIAEALVMKCPHAEIDEKIKRIAEGKFPWYIF
jgi:hypothetical protein